MFLILVDTHSKWMEVHTFSTATSQSNIKRMHMTFATHGLPEILVMDNGTVFTSTEFEMFSSQHRIKYLTSAPCHTATTGLAD